MDLAIGLVCHKCGNVFGGIRTAELGKKLEAVCLICAMNAAKEAGVTLDTPENWEVAFPKKS